MPLASNAVPKGVPKRRKVKPRKRKTLNLKSGNITFTVNVESN